MNLDPIIKERLHGVAGILSTLELDPEMWDINNPIWQNTNNHVMLMLRKYYDENETDPEIKAILGPLIDHLVWLYVIAPELRARLGWMTWFIIVYVTDNQFKKETGQMGMQPEPWNDPRNWALAKEVVNPITTVMIPNEPNESKGPT
jgi:hypothetical protein